MNLRQLKPLVRPPLERAAVPADRAGTSASAAHTESFESCELPTRKRKLDRPSFFVANALLLPNVSAPVSRLNLGLRLPVGRPRLFLGLMRKNGAI